MAALGHGVFCQSADLEALPAHLLHVARRAGQQRRTQQASEGRVERTLRWLSHIDGFLHQAYDVALSRLVQRTGRPFTRYVLHRARCALSSSGRRRRALSQPQGAGGTAASGHMAIAAGGKRLIWLDVTVKDVLAKYEMGETVGVGGFAVVKKGRDKETGQIVAIKVVDKWRYAGQESSEREIRILSKVSHANCIQMHAVFVTARRVYIVTDLVTGGELLDKVNERGMFSEPEAAHLTMQVLDGVNYLHQKGIVHRDLKLENILLDESQPCMRVKIADFGLSKIFSPSTTLSTVCGSPLYMAPELLTVEQQGEYSPAVDVWSVGVILFILLAGYSPFEDANDAVLFEKIKSGKYDDGDPVWDNISVGAKDLIAKMLDVHVENRPSAQQCLQHPWLREQAAKHEGSPGSAAAASAAAAAHTPTARQLTSVSRMLSSRVMQRTEVEREAAASAGAEKAAEGVSAEEVAAAAGAPLGAATAATVPRRATGTVAASSNGLNAPAGANVGVAPKAQAGLGVGGAIPEGAPDDESDDDSDGGQDLASYL